jgi:hypothetical protein
LGKVAAPGDSVVREFLQRPAGSNPLLKRTNAFAVCLPLNAHNAFAVRLPRYFRAPLCGFFSLVCRSLRALRLGLLMANVPLP